MLSKYYVTGWSGRFGMWIAEHLEAKSMAVAKERFSTGRPAVVWPFEGGISPVEICRMDGLLGMAPKSSKTNGTLQALE